MEGYGSCNREGGKNAVVLSAHVLVPANQKLVTCSLGRCSLVPLFFVYLLSLLLSISHAPSLNYSSLLKQQLPFGCGCCSSVKWHAEGLTS